MGAYKQLLASDIIVTPFEVNKGFTFNGAAELTGSNVGIDRYLGINFQNLPFSSGSDLKSGQIDPQYCKLVYNSIKELYYSNYFNQQIYGSPINRRVLIPGRDAEGDRYVGDIETPAYDNYLQSTLSNARFYPTSSNVVIGVLSIPSRLFGDYIQPGSFKLVTESGSYTDDGEGNLLTGSLIIGNILYPHGIITLTGNYYIYNPTPTIPGTIVNSLYATAVYASGTGPTVAIYGNRTLAIWNNSLLNAITSSNVTCSFSSSYTIYETQYKCTIRENEFNSTLNPSALSCSYDTGSNSGILNDNITGSYFDPYITTVGLYDEQQNLLAIGKLSQPLPSSPTTDTTILINLDR